MKEREDDDGYQRDALYASKSDFKTLFVLIASSAVGFLGWKAWQKFKVFQQEKEAGSETKQSQHKGKNHKSGRSPFSFGGPPKQTHQQATTPRHISSTIKTSTPPIASAPRGNHKKDKALRKQRKAEKQAKKNMERDNVLASKLIAEAAKKREVNPKDEGPKVETYVDYEKTHDGFHKVVEWQETGKKSYS